VATSNLHKVREIREILGPCFKVLSLVDFGLPSPEETGDSLKENARIKAEYGWRKTGLMSIGEDTGLFVKALKWAPGVYSARFFGGDAKENRKRLLYLMEGERDRYAEFRTVLAVYDGKSVRYFEGILPGWITLKERGRGGFGYDPIFIPEGHTITLAEMESFQKNAISHRGRAFRKFLKWLVKKL